MSNTYLQKRLSQIVSDISLLLHTNTWSWTIPENWEEDYKQLKVMRAFWDGESWDTIIKETGEEWIEDARECEAFKKYYKLRAEYDKKAAL